MPRIFDNIEQRLLPALQQALELANGPTSAWATSICAAGSTSRRTLSVGAARTVAAPILDDIDRVLAQDYGFTDEELDFIINYDIKYWMGLGSNGGGDGEDEG